MWVCVDSCLRVCVFVCVSPGDDYSVASSDVVLLEGESSKSVPIYIINDQVPELEEVFLIELLNQTTGGALLGERTRTVITIRPSDDPFGSFGERVRLAYEPADLM